jgi:hypothetical protein
MMSYPSAPGEINFNSVSFSDIAVAVTAPALTGRYDLELRRISHCLNFSMLSRSFTKAAKTALAPPAAQSPYISLSSPLTRGSLASITQALSSSNRHSSEETLTATEKHAAVRSHSRPVACSALTRNSQVLIPLCNVNNVPGILFEVRGQLRYNIGRSCGGTLHHLLLLQASLW